MQRRRVPRFYDVAAFGILFNTSDSTGSMDRANFADSRAYLVELLVTKFCACVGVGICANDCVFVPAISGILPLQPVLRLIVRVVGFLVGVLYLASTGASGR